MFASLQSFLNMYVWSGFPVTAAMDQMWKVHLAPHLRCNAQAIGVRVRSAASDWSQATAVASSSRSNQSRPSGVVSSTRHPSPIYVEGISVLERLHNYLYTGAAKVLPSALMRKLWILRGILDTGYPIISPVLSLGGPRKLTPMLDISKWPVDPVTHRPLTSSKRAQEISYGLPHYLVSARVSRPLRFL